MPTDPHACLARQHSDQMICHKCGLAWDMNDPDPPQCNRGKHVELETTKRRKTNQEQKK